MAQFRIETVADISNGKYYFEVYYPEDAATPQFKSDSVYLDMPSAEYDAIRIFKEALVKLGKTGA